LGRKLETQEVQSHNSTIAQSKPFHAHNSVDARQLGKRDYDGGNSAEYLQRRMARDAPDVLQRQIAEVVGVDKMTVNRVIAAYQNSTTGKMIQAPPAADEPEDAAPAEQEESDPANPHGGDNSKVLHSTLGTRSSTNTTYLQRHH